MSSSSTIPTPRTLLTNIFSPLPQEQEPSGLLSPTFKPTLLTLHILFPNECLPALDILDRKLITKIIFRDPDSANRNFQSLPDSPETNHSPHSPQPLGRTTTPSPKPHNLPRNSPPPSSKSANQLASTPLYYVTSSQQQQQQQQQNPPFTPRHNGAPPENQPTPNHEVRPTAWNCSCPAFTFSAFPTDTYPTTPSSPSSHNPPAPRRQKKNVVSDDENEEETWEFGGLSVGVEIPMCKHLLACLMVERWKGFGEHVEVREVSIEELAGWGAGWGG